VLFFIYIRGGKELTMFVVHFGQLVASKLIKLFQVSEVVE
jgi:hypothetical protein